MVAGRMATWGETEVRCRVVVEGANAEVVARSERSVAAVVNFMVFVSLTREK